MAGASNDVEVMQPAQGWRRFVAHRRRTCRAQSLYCANRHLHLVSSRATSFAERRNKAIAPYNPRQALRAAMAAGKQKPGAEIPAGQHSGVSISRIV
jgi:hypothetical protein